MTARYRLGSVPRVVASTEHHDGSEADIDTVHVVAVDHPTALASMLVGLVIETAEGPVYANRHGERFGPFADPAEARAHLATLHAVCSDHHHPRYLGGAA